MALTDHSDLYGSFHERGLNRILRHAMAKRPSLFNYGTTRVAERWEELLCCPVDVAPEVLSRSNPVVSIEDHLTIPGTGGVYGLDWAMQITEVAVDFHPSDAELPDELGGELRDQQLSLFIRVCAGVGCPDERAFDQFPPAPQPPFRIPGSEDPDDHDRPRRDEPPRQPVTLPTDQLSCFELDVYATAHAAVRGPVAAQTVELVLDGLEIVDITPTGLEGSLECYLDALLRYVVMPRLRVLLPVFVFDLPLGLGSVMVRAETGVPHNPAIEDDQLKVFVDMEVTS